MCCAALQRLLHAVLEYCPSERQRKFDTTQFHTWRSAWSQLLLTPCNGHSIWGLFSDNLFISNIVQSQSWQRLRYRPIVSLSELVPTYSCTKRFGSADRVGVRVVLWLGLLSFGGKPHFQIHNGNHLVNNTQWGIIRRKKKKLKKNEKIPFSSTVLRW